jgi:hypothetical protein
MAAAADTKAASLQGTLTSKQALGSDVCDFLHYTLLSSWQVEWTIIIQSNKFVMVKPSVHVW